VWAIIGIAAGGFVFLIVVAVMLMWCARRGKGEE
jgi:hypothetical protein